MDCNFTQTAIGSEEFISYRNWVLKLYVDPSQKPRDYMRDI